MEQQTPSLVLYSDLKSFGRINNRAAAAQLLSARPAYDGIAPRDRITEKTFLSREIVHAAPGSLPESFFADFGTSTLNLVASMASQLRKASRTANNVPATEAYNRIRDHYLGSAAADMRDALRGCGLDSALFGNALASIAAMDLEREENRAVLAFMMFVVTGCLGAPGRAVQIVERFMKNSLALSFRTVDLESSELEAQEAEQTTVGAAMGTTARDTLPGVALPQPPACLGLVRLIGGAMKTTIHPLSPSPEGSVVGSLVSGPGQIIDVGQTVSRRHLRIWRDAGTGRWFCEGLGSTNGTYITRATGQVVIVEPPRSRRAGWVPGPVEILVGDTLQLGSDTTFAVLPVAPE